MQELEKEGRSHCRHIPWCQEEQTYRHLTPVTPSAHRRSGPLASDLGNSSKADLLARGKWGRYLHRAEAEVENLGLRHWEECSERKSCCTKGMHAVLAFGEGDQVVIA